MSDSPDKMKSTEQWHGLLNEIWNRIYVYPFNERPILQFVQTASDYGIAN